MEQNRYILDSSILLALYIKNDSSKEAAFLLFEIIGGSEMIIPYCVIQEVSTILTYRVDKPLAQTFLEDVQSVNNIHIVDNHVQREIEFFKHIPSRISFTDASLLCLAKDYKATLLTFDKQLLRLYKKTKTR